MANLINVQSLQEFREKVCDYYVKELGVAASVDDVVIHSSNTGGGGFAGAVWVRCISGKYIVQSIYMNADYGYVDYFAWRCLTDRIRSIEIFNARSEKAFE